MSATIKPTRFAELLRAHLRPNTTLTIRGLARKMDPNNIGRARRNLHRWLDEGITPNRASRAEVAAALGIEARALESDDEEEDLPSALLSALSRWFASELRKAAAAA